MASRRRLSRVQLRAESIVENIRAERIGGDEGALSNKRRVIYVKISVS